MLPQGVFAQPRPIAVVETAGFAELKLSEVPPILVGKVYQVKNPAGLSIRKVKALVSSSGRCE
jgi:hypothetical protein